MTQLPAPDPYQHGFELPSTLPIEYRKIRSSEQEDALGVRNTRAEEVAPLGRAGADLSPGCEEYEAEQRNHRGEPHRPPWYLLWNKPASRQALDPAHEDRPAVFGHRRHREAGRRDRPLRAA